MKPHSNEAALEWLRAQFASVARPRRGLPRRIMVVRENAALRRCVNEQQVLRMAQARGFEPVRLEEMSFDDQVSLFAGAEAVLAVHGAGCTNMVFAPRTATLIELHPRGHLPAFYVRLTALLGQRHRSIPGIVTRSVTPLIPTFWDFQVDPAVVDACLSGF